MTKTQANTMDTFKAPEMGNLGELISNTPYFFYPPVKPTGKHSYCITNVTSIPRVDILFAYEDMHNDTLYNAVASGAKGIVVCFPFSILIVCFLSTKYASAFSQTMVSPKPQLRRKVTTHKLIPTPQIAGAGAGGVSSSFNLAIEDVLNNYDIPVVQSTRAMSGEVPVTDISSTTATHIASGYLNPQKSRILLGLLLAQRKNITEISEAFAVSTVA